MNLGHHLFHHRLLQREWHRAYLELTEFFIGPGLLIAVLLVSFQQELVASLQQLLLFELVQLLALFQSTFQIQ